MTGWTEKYKYRPQMGGRRRGGVMNISAVDSQRRETWRKRRMKGVRQVRKQRWGY